MAAVTVERIKTLNYNQSLTKYIIKNSINFETGAQI